MCIFNLKSKNMTNINKNNQIYHFETSIYNSLIRWSSNRRSTVTVTDLLFFQMCTTSGSEMPCLWASESRKSKRNLMVGGRFSAENIVWNSLSMKSCKVPFVLSSLVKNISDIIVCCLSFVSVWAGFFVYRTASTSIRTSISTKSTISL